MLKTLQVIVLLCLLVSIQSCVLRSGTPFVDDLIAKEQESIEMGHHEEPEVVPDEIDEVIETTEGTQSSGPVPPIGAEVDEINEALADGIPLEINEEVQTWIQYFTEKNPEMFQRFLDRGEMFKTMIVTTLRDQGVPTELYYLAMIESGFNVSAHSRARAMGLWQFIKGTGTRYGLRVDSYADERQDPRRSTIAASIYLNDLKNVFDSWYLAMAAYNAGELRILRAIMKGKTRDFWQLARGRYLPAETMNYIPKFLAALTIGSNPEKYGFKVHNGEGVPELVSIKVPAPMRLSKIASLGGLELEQLKEFNPHLKRGMTPPGDKEYRIWVPKERKEELLALKSSLEPHRLKIKADNRKLARRYHRVRRGETLASIARRYGLSVHGLKSINGLRSSRIYAGSRLVIRNGNGKQRRYKVRRGDNLNLIARRFGTSVQTIKKINKLKSTRIYAGQILSVGPRG